MVDPHVSRARLDQERSRLERVRHAFDDDHLDSETEQQNLAELSTFDQHQADIGTETFEREKDISILEQVEAELDEIVEAMRRLDSGTYGLCVACGQPIDPARLEAQPAARLCMADQREAERQSRGVEQR